MDTPAELAEVMKIKAKMGIPGGVLVVNPVPKEYELDPVKTRMAVDEAMHDVEKNHVQGKAITGYMMGRIREYLGKESMEFPEGIPSQQRRPRKARVLPLFAAENKNCLILKLFANAFVGAGPA